MRKIKLSSNANMILSALAFCMFFWVLTLFLPPHSYSESRLELDKIGTVSTLSDHKGDEHLIYISPNEELTEIEIEYLMVLKRIYIVHTSVYRPDVEKSLRTPVFE